MSTKGQTINDRLNAAKYTLAGQALARCICKATTEELMRPKKKHLDYLAASTYQPNVSMQQLTNLLIERTNHSNWAVVYKALITVHHLTCFGSERFIQYLASSNYTFQLSNFLDRIVTKGYEMSQFIRRYSNYINEKALSYRKLAIDLCRAQKRKVGDEVSLMRSMPIERLLETLPIIQKQMETLLDFGCNADDLNNSIITACFTLLNHDVTRLFASYNDGIINLFEKYFDLNKKMCREAFEAYKKFLSCTDRIAEFLKVAAAINLTNDKMPDFKQAPSSLLDAFEQHLLSLENNKKRDIKQEVDTKLAAFPSFSFNNDFDSQVAQEAAAAEAEASDEATTNEQPIFSDISKEFEAQLNFATSDNDFNAVISNSSANINSSNNSNNLDVFSDNQPFDNQFEPISSTLTSSSTSSAMIANNNNISINSKVALDSPFEPFATTNAGNNLFDVEPPGFSDGTLLTPEALQINIDPSIDPHTKQQLIKIKREQILANRHGGNSGAQHRQQQQSAGSGNKQSSGNTKPSKESMFEDLEKTMRKSLLKTENA